MRGTLAATLASMGGVVLLVGCGSSAPSGSQTVRALGGQACDAIFAMRNGGVRNLGEAVVKAVAADDASQIARGLDPVFAALNDSAHTIRTTLTLSDGTTPVQPGQFDAASLASTIEAAAHECVSLEAAGKVP